MRKGTRSRLTATGAIVGACSCVLLAVGLGRSLPLLVGLGVVGIAAVVGSFAEAVSAPDVEVAFKHVDQTIQRGQDADLTLVVTTLRGRPVRGYVLAGSGGILPGRLYVPPLGREKSVVVECRVTLLRRGEFAVTDVAATFVAMLGLAERSAPATAHAKVTVLPRVYPMLPPPMRERSLAAHRRTLARWAGSDEIRRLRPYVPGDDRRRLDWNATARTGTLLVRELADPLNDETVIVVDDSAQVPPRVFEEIVDVAASLHAACRRASLPSRIVPVSLELRFRDPRRALTLVTHQPGDGSRLAAGVWQPALPVRYGSLVVLSAGVRADDAIALAALRRRASRVVVVDLAPRSPSVAMPGLDVILATDAENAVNAWNGASR